MKRKKNDILFPRAVLCAYAAVYPLILFLSLENLNPVSQGLWQNIGALFVSAVIVLLLALIFYSIIGNVFASYVIVTFIFLFAYGINHFKLQVMGGIFVPSDFRLARAALSMIDREALVIEQTFILRIVLVLMLLAPLCLCKIKIGFKKRVLTLPASLCVFLLIHFNFGIFGFMDGRTFDRYRDNGFILGFFSELAHRGTNEFLDVSPQEISQKFAYPIRHEGTPLPDTPNVIVIMSESFFDPTVLPNIIFSQNPVPNFHRLAKEHLSGSLVVPTVGGGTSNTEFEFLAGSPHVFFGNRWYVPFENYGRYFYADIPTALPWMFRQSGYRTVGVHTFFGDFFNRDRIYPRLGFDRFLSSEHMPDAVFRGDFISDAYFTDRIIEQVLLAEETGEPLFLFGISMQNHWPYHESRYGDMVLDVTVKSPKLGPEEIGIMNTFLQGVFDADRELGRLIDFVDGRHTPTIVVFFGDHLPLLGISDLRIFEKLGFLSIQNEWEWNLQDTQNMFTSHYLVWTNFEHGRECFGTVSAFLLGALVAEVSGICLNRYFTYLLGSANFLRVLTSELFLAAGGEMESGSRGRDNPKVKALESLWHHKMFGRGDFSQALAELVPRY